MAPPITYLKPAFSELAACAGLAAQLHRHPGGACSREAFAQLLGNTATSSWFGLKRNAMTAYGFIEVRGGTVLLTTLGEQIAAPLDAAAREGARRTALTRFPLFAPLVARYQGPEAPARARIQHALVTATTVPPSQAAAWAQCFLKAAHFAGVFTTPAPPRSLPGPPTPPPPNEEVPRGWLTYPVPVAEGLAKIIVPPHLPHAAWEKLHKLLEVLEPAPPNGGVSRHE